MPEFEKIRDLLKASHDIMDGRRKVEDLTEVITMLREEFNLKVHNIPLTKGLNAILKIELNPDWPTIVPGSIECLFVSINQVWAVSAFHHFHVLKARYHDAMFVLSEEWA